MKHLFFCLGDGRFSGIPPQNDKSPDVLTNSAIVSKFFGRTAALSLIISALALPQAETSARIVTDSAGRKVAVPEQVERVYPAGPPASIFLYVLAPEKMLGWPRAPTPEEGALLAPAYRSLPDLGQLGDTANLEVVLETRPELVFDYGTIAPTYISLAERTQRQTGLPYLLIDGRFDNIVRSIRLMGAILGVEDRAEVLAGYAQRTFESLDKTLARTPADERPRVYLARGPDGLETGVRGSINTEIIERVGAINVAAAPGQQGLSRVSLEQVLRWNTDTILTLDERFYNTVWAHPVWSKLTAVQNKRVYLAPSLPFGWIDQPPSINRLIGITWLTRLFYPSAHQDRDMRDLVREFYRLFYQVKLSDMQLAELLKNAGPAAY